MMATALSPKYLEKKPTVDLTSRALLFSLAPLVEEAPSRESSQSISYTILFVLVNFKHRKVFRSAASWCCVGLHVLQ